MRRIRKKEIALFKPQKKDKEIFCYTYCKFMDIRTLINKQYENAVLTLKKGEMEE